MKFTTVAPAPVDAPTVFSLSEKTGHILLYATRNGTSQAILKITCNGELETFALHPEVSGTLGLRLGLGGCIRQLA